MSALVKIIKNPFDINIEEKVIKVKAKTCIKDIKGVDPNNSVAYVNGEHVENDYILKNGDVCVIRQYPSDPVTTVAVVLTTLTVAGLGEVVLKAVTGHGYGYWIKEGIKNWILPNTDGLSNSVDTSVETLPSLSGGKNQSAFGKVIPLVLGQVYWTPYYECKMPYNTISGEDGCDQYYHCLYLLSYKDVQVDSVSIGLETLSQNTQHVANGDLPITSEKYPTSTHNTHLELRTGGDNNSGEVTMFPCKVIQDNYQIQLMNVNGDADYIYAFSSRYAKKVELEFTFGGLVKFNSSNGNKEQLENRVEITIEYSLDGGTTWIYAGGANNCKFDFSQATGTNGYDSTSHKIYFNNNKSKTLRYVLTHSPTVSEMETCNAKTIQYRIKRTSSESTDSNVIDKIYLTAVRTWCYDATATKKWNTAHPSDKQLIDQAPMAKKQRNKTARLGFSIRVTDDLVNNFDKVNVMLQGKGRIWDSTEHKWTKALYTTRNPASIALQLLTGDFRDNYKYDITYEGDYVKEVEKIDLESFGAFYEICNVVRDFGDGTTHRPMQTYLCDGVVVNATKTIDLANKVLQCGRSFIVMNGKKYGVFTDKAQEYPLVVLNNNNLLSLTYSKNYEELPDGQNVKYISSVNYYQQDTIVVKPLGSSDLSDSDKLESVEYPFITDPYHAQAMSLYQQACRKLRPETLDAKVTGEGGLAEVGSIVATQSDRILVGIGDGAEITELVTSSGNITGIKTDGHFTVSDITKDYGVVINIVDSTGNAKILRKKLADFTQTGVYADFTFDTPITSQTDRPEEGCIISFGIYESEVLETLCVGKNENGDGTYNLTLVPYDERIYTADQYIVGDFDPKVTPPTEAGSVINFGEKTVPITKQDVVGIVAESKDMSTPPVPSSTNAVAKRDYIEVTWQATDDIVGYTEIQLSKNGGTSWTTVERIKANNYNYYFDRSVDGYPEYTKFGNNGDYKFRLRNVSINGVESAWVNQTIDPQYYGTWIPATPSFTSKIPSEGGITFNWNQATGQDRTLYGTQKYTVTVKYEDADHSVSEITLGTLVTNTLTVNYDFDRASNKDGYPEKVATANYKGLDKYKFILSVENESGGTPVSSTASTFSNDEVALYKTWIPKPCINRGSYVEEGGISFQWDDDSDCYGTNYYTIVQVEEQPLHRVIPSVITTTKYYYSFVRTISGNVADGYPEESDIYHWKFGIHTTNSQSGRESGLDIWRTFYPDTSQYLGWQPNTPTVETRSSGRTVTISPLNTDRKFGKIMYKLLVCNPAIDYVEEGGERTYKWYLPTPTADPFGAETNYKNSSQENVPFLSDSPYSQTMPLKDQTATKYKLYSFSDYKVVEPIGTENPQEKGWYEYDGSDYAPTTDTTVVSSKTYYEPNYVLIYTDTEPPVGATQQDVYIDGVLVEDAYCWTTSGTNFISFEVSMPSPKDTIYWYKVVAYNATTESVQPKSSSAVEAQVTAFATSAYDVVKAGITENALAPDAVTTDKIAAGTITANKIFVEALSAISANLGAITDGSLVGNQNNYWYLSDEYSGGQIVHRAGDFQVGTPVGDYIKCEGYIDTDDVLKYNITMHASKFEITAIGIVAKGAFYVSPNDATINPNTGIPSSYYARIDSSGVSINGDVSVDGDVHVGKDKIIYADGTCANSPIIRFKDNTTDANGNGIVIGGGGATVIGGGESANAYYNGAGYTAGNERMVVANDGAITFASNLNSGYACRKEMTLGTDGKLTNTQGFVGDVTGNATCATNVCVNADTANSNRYLLLGETSYSASCASCVYTGNSCKATFNTSTGVLTAKTFCGCATRAGYATCLYNRPASGTASAKCNVFFYTGCTNAECTATNYVACICGSNGWMYGLWGIFVPYVRAPSPSGTASKICNMVINAYCTNAECTSTTRTWTFCGSNGYLYTTGAYMPNIRANSPASTASKICNVTICAYCTDASSTLTTRTFVFCGSTGKLHGNVCGNASCASLVYLDSFTASADRPVMIACPRGSTGYSDQGVSTVCPLTFNPANGHLCTCSIYGTFRGRADSAYYALCSCCAIKLTSPQSNIPRAMLAIIACSNCMCCCASGCPTFCVNVYCCHVRDTFGVPYLYGLRILTWSTTGLSRLCPSTLCITNCTGTIITVVDMQTCASIRALANGETTSFNHSGTIQTQIVDCCVCNSYYCYSTNVWCSAESGLGLVIQC